MVNNQLRDSTSARGILAGQALLYDTIVIPTMDFGILPALLQWLSLPALLEALEDRSIQMIRYPKIVGYGGNGAGIIANISFGKGESSAWQWWHSTMYGSLDSALELQLKHGCQHLPEGKRKALFKAVMPSCIEFQVSDELNRKIASESYQDISGDNLLRNEIGKYYNYRDIDLGRLPGVESNQIRFFNGNQIANLTSSPVNGIDLVLILAHLNLQIAMSSTVDDCDLSTFDGAARILKRKLERAGVRRPTDPAFSRLMQIPGVPNVPSAVAEGRLDVPSIWRARQSANAIEFRRWFKRANAGDERELARLYVDALQNEPIVASLPARVLRWAVLTAAGAAASRLAGLPGELVVAALAAADSLFVEKWLSGYRPSLFIDELKRIRIQPPPLRRCVP